MNRLATTLILSIGIALCISTALHAQAYQQVRDSDMPPDFMFYSPIKSVIHIPDTIRDWRFGFPTMRKATAPAYGTPVLAGIMYNAYTCQSRATNQLGCNAESETVSLIYRAGPPDEYPNGGNGSLVINTTYDRGATWTGNSDIFNEDLPGNIDGKELSARHPSIYAMSIEGTHSIASVWSNIYATFLNPDGILGELCHKAGPLGGPYSGGKFGHEHSSQAVPTRMASDMNGTLYALFQTLNKDTDLPTGEYYLMKSLDNGLTWLVDYETPCLTTDAINPFDIFYDAMTIDVSPDGTTLYIGFISIYVENEQFTFGDNQFGYVRSTDGGATWSEPYLYPLYIWDMGATPVNTLDGFMYPSLAVAVDGMNEAHFLISVNGRDTFYPLDSTLIGELTVNAEDPSEPPEFFALASNTLPDYRRMINPAGATGPEQPTFSIWAEHEWSKDKTGDHLVAKWIDADSVFVFNPNVERNHPDAFVRDSTHDIFILRQNVAQRDNADHGWEIDPGTGDFNVINVTESPGVDEKFSKTNPVFNSYLYFIYTIMATGEFVTGQIFPDTDDLGPAELFLITHPAHGPIAVESIDTPASMTLAQNYPNPFAANAAGAGTTIRFSLERASQVTLAVYDMLGRRIATVLDGFREAGIHTVPFMAEGLPAGQYVYRMEDGTGTAVARIMTILP